MSLYINHHLLHMGTSIVGFEVFWKYAKSGTLYHTDSVVPQ